MTIKIGDKIPSINLKRLGEGGMEDFNIADYIAKKKVVIFAVPGAFTPACSQKHLPGYIESAKDIKAKGVDEIICIAVNDPFVMKHWGETAGAKDKVTMIPDGNGEFTKAIGLDFDGSGYGLATRSKRYSMIVENGKITKLNVEAKPGDVELSGAQACVVSL
ncbi:MAG: peroxiredoxin [Alphaproteobacteria bacterium]|nr:peroxiredoxin [Alphaproteobacteria bacterium]MBP7758506.1 peroxiredoxin [Alphaproteobacteria bacterium]MBP7761939.1 peroxiredoxin [Alphaproteobacteria bacterium]MBP7905763.1 peroxiredoxin [Alphaproteobacteria bacterium]